MQEEMKTKTKEMLEGKEELLGWRRQCLAGLAEEVGFAGGAAVEAGGREKEGRGKERAAERRGRPMMAMGCRPTVVLASCYGYEGVRANGSVVRL
jgi:hypothetical protein